MHQFDAILQKHVACGEDTQDKLLGAAFAVVDRDGIRHSSSAGRIGPDIGSAPWTVDGSFTWVASLTKLLTSTCLLQLVERGQIGLEDDLREIVPELAGMQILRGFDGEGRPRLEANTRAITLKILLTHTLGLGYDLADPDLMKWSKAVGRTATNLDWSKEGFMTPLRFAPGDGWYYGAAVDWAGQALEKVTGKPLSAYMQEHLFDPLGMHKTTFWPDRLPHVEPETCAYMYRGQDGRVAKGSPPIPVKEHEMESGGAGLFTTAGDYAVFMAALLGGRLLREETMDRMFGAQLDEAQSAALRFIAYHVGAKDALAPEFPVDLPLNHGLGGVMNVEDVPEKRRAGSLMWSGMCNSRWWIDRRSGVGAVLMTNVQPHGDSVVAKLWDELEREVYAKLE